MPLIKQSTKDFWRTGRESGLGFWQILHGYVYGRWAYHYIGMAHDKHKWLQILVAPILLLYNRHAPFRPGKKGYDVPLDKRLTFADTYHGKAVPLEEAVKLVHLDRPVDTELPEQVVPYSRARRLVLESKARIVVMDCPCRTTAKNPCLPLDVCLIVGDPMASFVLEHHPDKSREIDANEAESILKACNARGNVTHAFFKDVIMGRFYALCNCCSCCCGAMQAQRAGCTMLCSSGYLAAVDEETCVGCGQCVQYCQFKAIAIRERTAVIREKRCMGCGVCVSKCPKDALSLNLAPEKGAPLKVDELA